MTREEILEEIILLEASTLTKIPKILDEGHARQRHNKIIASICKKKIENKTQLISSIFCSELNFFKKMILSHIVSRHIKCSDFENISQNHIYIFLQNAHFLCEINGLWNFNVFYYEKVDSIANFVFWNKARRGKLSYD